MTKTRTAKLGLFSKTIYRKCSCRETAHDYAGRNVYKCRNCGSEIVATFAWEAK